MKLPGLIALALVAALPACTLSFDESVLEDAGVEIDASEQDSGPDATTCTGALTACDGRCVNVRTDEANCGECGNACANLETCTQSRCSNQNEQ